FFARRAENIFYHIKPWLRYPLCNPKGATSSPGHMQKAYPKILKKIGTPSTYQPPRNIPPGRSIGEVIQKRSPQAVIRKNKTGHQISQEKKSQAPSMSSHDKEYALKNSAKIINESIKIKQAATCFNIFLLIIVAGYLFSGSPWINTAFAINYGQAERIHISPSFENALEISKWHEKGRRCLKQTNFLSLRCEHDPPATSL
ncbi:MAG: hypothetical protein HQK51_09450, partial [Oligoflexia bacterium]|nr:hypothetical protein [Oligoflexia bacterium]